MLPTSPDAEPPADFGHIALTVTEARRLFQLFTNLLRDLPTALATRRTAFLQWSTWRRRHQARSRRHHYKRRLADLE